MAIPELYRYGREGLWFGAIPFSIFMIEGVYQVRVHLHNILPILIANWEIECCCVLPLALFIQDYKFP